MECTNLPLLKIYAFTHLTRSMLLSPITFTDTFFLRGFSIFCPRLMTSCSWLTVHGPLFEKLCLQTFEGKLLHIHFSTLSKVGCCHHVLSLLSLLQKPPYDLFWSSQFLELDVWVSSMWREGGWENARIQSGLLISCYTVKELCNVFKSKHSWQGRIQP